MSIPSSPQIPAKDPPTLLPPNQSSQINTESNLIHASQTAMEADTKLDTKRDTFMRSSAPRSVESINKDDLSVAEMAIQTTSNLEATYPGPYYQVLVKALRETLSVPLEQFMRRNAPLSERHHQLFARFFSDVAKRLTAPRELMERIKAYKSGGSLGIDEFCDWVSQVPNDGLSEHFPTFIEMIFNEWIVDIENPNDLYDVMNAILDCFGTFASTRIGVEAERPAIESALNALFRHLPLLSHGLAVEEAVQRVLEVLDDATIFIYLGPDHGLKSILGMKDASVEANIKFPGAETTWRSVVKTYYARLGPVAKSLETLLATAGPAPNDEELYDQVEDWVRDAIAAEENPTGGETNDTESKVNEWLERCDQVATLKDFVVARFNDNGVPLGSTMLLERCEKVLVTVHRSRAPLLEVTMVDSTSVPTEGHEAGQVINEHSSHVNTASPLDNTQQQARGELEKAKDVAATPALHEEDRRG
ncbi:hypothetical protein SISNIDRAFT_541702 [Sistotremastrum niveocremeum HHB9708]|uniref:Uncharacterized protein n=1 Tax=Sistotremastrum niveocremeum HHB9708 TaxID=1314777 RepID=A0A164WV34_9AGAM|nr:hypothetical protein SISNIDRAFT_541702 [Sistotremastrum niveocremeum HHB9708]